jgi:hypothetical protein
MSGEGRGCSRWLPQLAVPGRVDVAIDVLQLRTHGRLLFGGRRRAALTNGLDIRTERKQFGSQLRAFGWCDLIRAHTLPDAHPETAYDPRKRQSWVPGGVHQCRTLGGRNWRGQPGQYGANHHNRSDSGHTLLDRQIWHPLSRNILPAVRIADQVRAKSRPAQPWPA